MTATRAESRARTFPSAAPVSCAPLRVLVACEFSGVVRDAFIRRGHSATSCDLGPSERPGPHYQGDVREILGDGWDLIIAHPPCTYLANSGVCWLSRDPLRLDKMLEAREFFMDLLNAPCERVAVENPTPHGYAKLPPYTQAVQPCEFGHLQTKRTCLWLRGLPPLMLTDDCRQITSELQPRERMPLWWGRSRSKRDRSRTFEGIASAMADQWGGYASS